MPYAVTHILVPIILVDLFRDYILRKKGIITNKHVLLAGLAGLFPDIDIPIGYLFLGGVSIHRMYSHNIWFPLLFLSISIFLYSINKKKISLYFIMMSFGFLTHIILDGALSGYICPFYPLSTYTFGLDIIPRLLVIFFPQFSQQDLSLLVFSSMDAVLLFFWLLHEQLTHKIRDYF